MKGMNVVTATSYSIIFLMLWNFNIYVKIKHIANEKCFNVNFWGNLHENLCENELHWKQNVCVHDKDKKHMLKVERKLAQNYSSHCNVERAQLQCY